MAVTLLSYLYCILHRGVLSILCPYTVKNRYNIDVHVNRCIKCREGKPCRECDRN